jgi:hypothetical protein
MTKENPMKNNKKLSRSITALALAAAMALTGCDAADDDPETPAPGDTTTTSLVEEMTTTTLAP